MVQIPLPVLGEVNQLFQKVDMIVVGLGNPGPDYRNTRHNIGFEFVDLFARRLGLSFSSKNRIAHVAEGVIGNSYIVLARPRTFVNRSGDAVTYLLSRYSVLPSQLLAVYDDIHIPVGKMRLRARGSAGGHNGVRSIVNSLSSNEFPRLRIGIGMPEQQREQISYVLGKPTPDEKELIDEATQKGMLAVECIMEKGIDAAMSQFN
jgi:PTH1 family peptidyl-tRNA hydrolase